MLKILMVGIQEVNGKPNAVIFSAATAWDFNIFALTYQNAFSINGFRYMPHGDIVFGTGDYHNKNTIEIYRESVKYNGTSINVDNGIYTANNLGTLHICGENRYNDSGNQHNFYKTHSFKIYENERLIRYFIPCYLKSDTTKAGGLYDIINGQFYANAGTGTFAVGADV